VAFGGFCVYLAAFWGMSTPGKAKHHTGTGFPEKETKKISGALFKN
jgi:hypothetical protein